MNKISPYVIGTICACLKIYSCIVPSHVEKEVSSKLEVKCLNEGKGQDRNVDVYQEGLALVISNDKSYTHCLYNHLQCTLYYRPRYEILCIFVIES